MEKKTVNQRESVTMEENVRPRDLSNKRWCKGFVRFNSKTQMQSVSYTTLAAINYQMSNSNLIPTLIVYLMNQTTIH